MVTIKEVKSKSDLNRFIKFGIDLYKGNKYFCPPLIFDEKNTFNRKKNPAYDFSDLDGAIRDALAGIHLDEPYE